MVTAGGLPRGACRNPVHDGSLFINHVHDHLLGVVLTEFAGDDFCMSFSIFQICKFIANVMVDEAAIVDFEVKARHETCPCCGWTDQGSPTQRMQMRPRHGVTMPRETRPLLQTPTGGLGWGFLRRFFEFGKSRGRMRGAAEIRPQGTKTNPHRRLGTHFAEKPLFFLRAVPQSPGSLFSCEW